MNADMINPISAADEKQPARPASRSAQGAAIFIGLVLTGSYLALAYGYFMPQDLLADSRLQLSTAIGAFMVRTFQFHLGIAILGLALLAAILRRWRLALAHLPALTIAFAPYLPLYLPKSPAPISGEQVRVASANLLANCHHTGQIVAEVGALGAEVLLLQEYAPHWHSAFYAALHENYPYREFVVRDDSFGLAVYSKRPLYDVRFDLPLGTEGTPEMRAEIEIDGRRVAIYNVHLWPPSGAWMIREQRQQLLELAALLRAERLPALVCGDFNLTDNGPYAAVLHEIGCLDSHAQAGWGVGPTWPVIGWTRWLPGIRIDHIYVRGGVTAQESGRGIGMGSDHRPIWATIGLQSPLVP